MGDGARRIRTSAITRVVVGLVLGGLGLVVAGLVAFPYLAFPRDRTGGEYDVVPSDVAWILADELTYSMSNQEITVTVSRMGATVADLRRKAGEITVLVVIPYSRTSDASRTCYSFLLAANDHGVTFEETARCEALPEAERGDPVVSFRRRPG